MAILRGPGNLREDELNQIQDPELPGPLGLDMNNPMVQAALAKMNIEGFEEPIQPEQEAAPSTMDKLTAALASSKPVSQPMPMSESKPQESTMPKEIDFSGSNKNYADDLKKAQDSYNSSALINRLAQSASLIGAGIAGAKPVQNEGFEANIKDSAQQVEQLKQRKDAEASDPNSGYSKGLREWAKKTYNIDLKGASAEQVAKIAPYLEKQYEAQKALEGKKDLQREKLEERRYESGERAKDRDLKRSEIAQTNKDKQEAKNAARYDTDFRRLGEKLTEETASSRSVLGKAANISRSADAIETLATQVPDPNNLDNRQIQEIARNLDAMLSSGASTISGTEKLVPHTATGDTAKIAEYIAGIPKGSQQGDFVRRMIDTVKRERELAKKQIGTAKKKLVSGYGHLEKADKERYDSIMKAHSLGDDSYSEAQERGIQRVMDSNKVSREEAIKALKDAGKL